MFTFIQLTNYHNIIDHEITWKEEYITNHNLSGCMCFIVSFCWSYDSFPDNDKLFSMTTCLSINEPNPPSEPEAKVDGESVYHDPNDYTKHTFACNEWKIMTNLTKEAWKIRAKKLNERPPEDGSFLVLPDTFDGYDVQLVVCQVLKTEFHKYVAVFKEALQ